VIGLREDFVGNSDTQLARRNQVDRQAALGHFHRQVARCNALENLVGQPCRLATDVTMYEAVAEQRSGLPRVARQRIRV
jgi:hypothetical protein